MDSPASLPHPTLRYERTGGGHPLLREVLEVGSDGAFQLVRHVSAARLGTFAGVLDASAQKQLFQAVVRLKEPLRLAAPGPGTVLEQVTWAGGAASFPLEAKVPSKWRQLRGLLQALVEDLKRFPVAALELRVDAPVEHAVLESVGRQPVNAGFVGSALVLSLFDERQAYLGTATVELPPALKSAGPLAPGWRQEISLRHGLAFYPQRTLQLLLYLQLEGAEGQLSCVVGRGWR